jgi:hypothetical protein
LGLAESNIPKDAKIAPIPELDHQNSLGFAFADINGYGRARPVGEPGGLRNFRLSRGPPIVRGSEAGRETRRPKTVGDLEIGTAAKRRS